MATEPETIETPIADEDRSRFNPQRLALLIGGAVAIFALVYFFVLRGGGEQVPPENLPPLIAPVPSESPEPTESPEDDDGRVETFEVFAARDPFEPVLDESGGAGAGDTADAGDTDGVTDTGDTDTGDTDTGGPGTDTVGRGGTQVGGEDGSETHRVRVVAVNPSRGRAQVQVDGTVYEVEEGERFADNFQLVNASRQCATMLFGDDEFTLCEGEEILK